jgi:hypothetical protein
MHVMLKRAAASAIPALLGLAISPATAMAAPQTGHLIGGSADGVIAFGKGSTLIGNHLYVTAGPGIDNSTGATVGNGVAGTAGNSLEGSVFAAVPPQ